MKVCVDCSRDICATTENPVAYDLGAKLLMIKMLKYSGNIILIAAFSNTYVNSRKQFKNCCLYIARFLPLAFLTQVT